MWRMKMSDNKLSSVVLTGEEGGKNMRYMRCWHITLKTLTCTYCTGSVKRVMKRDTLNTWTRWVNDAGCTRCFQHKDLQRNMLQSTLKDTDALDVVDLVDLHGRFRHNRASRSASHHPNLSLHSSPWNSASRLSFLDWTWLHTFLRRNLNLTPCDSCMVLSVLTNIHIVKLRPTDSKHLQALAPEENISNQSWYSWDQTPENPKPSNLVTSDYTEISWKSWQKAFDLQVSFAATSRALPAGCDTLRIDTVYCQKRRQVGGM